MGHPFKLDDLLGGASDTQQPTETKPPQQKKPGQGFALGDLLGSDSTAAAPVVPATTPAARNGAVGDVDLRTPADTGAAPVVAPSPAPAPRRGIGARIGDALLAGTEAYGTTALPGASSAAALAGVYRSGEESRRPATIEDRRTPGEKLAAAKARVTAGIGATSDATQVRPMGSPMQTHEDERTAQAIQQDKERRGRFTPEKWRDIARQGAELANRLHAEGKHDEAEDANRKAYNAQLIADGAERADTFGAIALSSLLGIFHDPYAEDKANLAQIEREQSTFTPEEQERELGSTAPVEMRRAFDPAKDLGAPLVGSLPLYVAGGAIGRTAAASAAELLGGAEATGARGALSRGLARLASEAEVTGVPEGELLSGRAGVRQAVENYRQNIGTLIKRGATEGQVIGAVQAAREAQQTGEDPTIAATSAVVLGAPMGIIGELAFGAAGRVLPLLDRTITSGIRRTLDDLGKIGYLPEESDIARAVEMGREAQGQTPLADQTVTGQHATIAKALAAVLDQKKEAPTFGSESGLILRDPTALDARPAPVEVNPPLRSARDIGLERAGYVEPRPSEEANALVQMERARQAAEAEQRMVAEEAERARIEQAATQRAVERQGPLTLSQTIARAARDAEAGEPLAAEYSKAIRDFADVSARMKDAGENVSEKLRFDWQAAKRALNRAREQYGTQAGVAAIAALAANDDDLTDEEKRAIGMGALAVGSMHVMRSLPPNVRKSAIDALEKLRTQYPTEEAVAAPRQNWMDQFEQMGVRFGAHYADIDRQLHAAAMALGDPEAAIPVATVRQIIERGEPVEITRAGANADLTQRALVALDKLPHVDDVRTLRRWVDSMENAGLSPDDAYAVEQTLLRLGGGDDSLSQPRADVQRALLEGVVPAQAPARTARFYSRLTKAIETLPGKAWDSPRPAGDWLGKLKGLNTFTRAEFSLIEDALKEAQASKTKLTRADVLAIADERVPRISRETFERAPRPAGENAPAHRAADIVPLEDIDDIETLTRDELQGHIDAREERIGELRDEMDVRLSEAADRMHAAEESASTARRRFDDVVAENFGDAAQSNAIDRAFEYIDENVEAEYVPRYTVDKAFEKLMEDGEFMTLSEPHEPETQGLSLDEGEDADGNTVWTVRTEHGDTYEGPTKWEALAKAERAGVYESGGHPDFMLPDGYTVEQRPRYKLRVTEPDGTVHEGNVGNRTLEEGVRVAHEKWGADARVEDITPPDAEQRWLLKDRHGRVMQDSPYGRDDLIESYVLGEFDPPNDEHALSDLKDYLERYADAQAEWRAAESEHYWLDEGEGFEQEHAEISTLEDEISTLEAHKDNAPEEREPPTPQLAAPGEATGPIDPFVVPARPKPTGSPKFETYQRIGGGWEYTELLNVWENNPGTKFTRGHWPGNPDTVSHVRLETHEVTPTPGLDGERVEFLEPRGTEAYALREKIAEKRAERRKVEAKLDAIMREYNDMPQDMRDGSPRAAELAKDYQKLAQQATDLAMREDQLASDLRLKLGLHATPPERVRVLIETQSDLAQRATEYGVRRVPTAAESAVYAEAYAPLNARALKLDTEIADLQESQLSLEKAFEHSRNQYRDELVRNGTRFEDANRESSEVFGDIQDWTPGDQGRIAAVDTAAETFARNFAANTAAFERMRQERIALVAEIDALKAQYFGSPSSSAVPAGPYTETRTAQALNAARALMDTADRGYTNFAWSDASNRVRLAHLPMPAAKLTYDEMVTSNVKSLLGLLGFKDVPVEHKYINGYGHWMIRLTPEMRAAIRKHGLPVLGVLGLMAAPSDADAQGVGGQESSDQKMLYGTAVGGIAAGALLMAMATNKKLRRLVKENRSLNRALLMDDLSGLSNQRAFLLARESIDRDPNTAWITFDANRFKAYNDTHGHPEGDKVIQHFGRVIREQVEKLDVPPRMFRSGGDEFSLAVPKERADEVLRAIEDASPLRKGGVEASLTGAIGDTHGEADALLKDTKQANAKLDPTLARGWMPGKPEVERPEINAALAEEMKRVLEKYGLPAAALAGVLSSDDDQTQAGFATAALIVTGKRAKSLKYTPELVERVVKAFTEGATLKQVAEQEGKSIGAVQGWLKQWKQQGVIAEDKAVASKLSKVEAELRAKLDALPLDARLDKLEGPVEHVDSGAGGGSMYGAYAHVHVGIATPEELAAVRARLAQREAGRKAISSAISSTATFYSNPIGPALSELKKYPSAAAIGVIGYAMTDSDNENIRRAGVPTIALAALSAIGSARLMAGGDYLGTKLVNVLRQSEEGTKLVRAFNPDALLDPEVRDAILQFERDHAKGVARAAEFSKQAKRLGPEGDRAVSDVLDDEAWEDTAQMSAEQQTDVLTVAAALKDEYDRLTQEQLAAGTLRPSEVLPNYGGPRRYAYFDAQAALAEHPSAAQRGPGREARITSTRTRTLDIPLREAEETLKQAQAGGDPAAIQAAKDALDQAKVVQMSQRIERGEIREASYRAAQGIEKAHNNVASAKLFETIRNVPGSAHPEWVSAVDDLMAAKDMYRTATSDSEREAADLLQHEAGARLAKITATYRRSGGDYVSLPDTPGLGALRGAVVKRDIAHSLEGFGQPGTYGKALRAWKELKTVFNLGTSVGNILSNVAALHVGEVPLWLQPHYLTQAVRDLSNYGEGTRALAEAGILNVNETTARGEGEVGRGMRSREGLEELLGTTRPETGRVLRQQGITEESIANRAYKNRLKRMAAGAVVGGLKAYDPDDPEATATGALVGAGVGAVFTGKTANWMRRLYGNEDNVARLAVFLRRRKLGDTIEQATEAATNSLGNFRTRSPALRATSATVSPFILYTAKAVPAFVRSAIDHPWKYLTLMAAFGAMNELSKDEVGEVPERDIPIADRRSYGYFFPGFTQLPFADDRGNKAAIDLARWTPISGLTTGAPPGSAAEAFSDDGSALVTPGGPVIDAALKASNIDPFTRDPLLKRDRPTSENVARAGREVANFMLPSSLAFHYERLKTDIQNEDWTKFKNDLLGPTGAKPRYVRPGAVAVDAVYTLRRSLADMKQQLRKDLRANKNPERVRELARQYQTRVATALANFKRRLGEAPPADLVHDYMEPEP